MPSPPPAVALAQLRATWDAEVRPSARRALFALAFAVFFAGAHLARLGTPASRALAATAFIATLLAFVVRAVVLRRRRADPVRVVRDTVIPVDPELGSATLRALGLVERVRSDANAGSPSLAALHLTRLLGRASPERVAECAAEARVRWSSLGLAFAAAAAFAALAEPFRILEGLNVMVARQGEAPVRLPWVDEVEMLAAPPEYLHQPAHSILPFVAMATPRGTTISMRGSPVRHGRALVLTNGTDEIPLVDDGTGGVVGRWVLGESTTLWIAARFGDVRIRQTDEQRITSIADEAPRVTVEGAPRTVRLLDEPKIPIRYEAVDDHGLREVHLVLRAGTREERRVLSRPATDSLVERGGYEIRALDPFFRRTYAPVEITVEARDNDVVSGPKWGKSAAIVVIPPQVGEPEALRFAAFEKARDALTDLVAARVTDTLAGEDPFGKSPVSAPLTAVTTPVHVKQERDAQTAVVGVIEETLAGSYGGLTMRGLVTKLTRGQLRRLRLALEAETKRPDGAKHRKLLDETEDVLLAIDAGVRALGVSDTRKVARRLADVADEAAAAASPADSGSGRPGAAARLDAAVQVLGGGGEQLLRIGELGMDLGEIVQNDLRRIDRARKANDLFHAELAARDLAARLRRPDPSFVGGGSHGGVESGGGSGSAGDGEPSEANEAAKQAAREIGQIADEHSAEVDEVEHALDKAAPPEQIAALKEELKQHADAIREAVKQLPKHAGDPSSAEGEAAKAREQAESMAGALEGSDLSDATEMGKRAAKALDAAQRAGEQPGTSQDERAAREAAKARDAIERELAWAEDALEKLRQAASERAKDDLQKSGKKEQGLGERAKKLLEKGESGDGSLPDETLERLNEAEEAMREAERALKAGDGEKGLRAQREAQRLLEMAKGDDGEEGQDDGDGDKQSPEAKRFARKAEIPDKNKHKGPEEFRRRVMDGLGGSTDPLLRDAIKRYAEGLLR